MDFRYNIDPDTDEPHIYNHGLTEEEVEYVVRHPAERAAARDGAMQALGQTRAGRYIRVIYVPDEDYDGVFVVTANEVRGKPLRAHRRRRRRR